MSLEGSKLRSSRYTAYVTRKTQDGGKGWFKIHRKDKQQVSVETLKEEANPQVLVYERVKPVEAEEQKAESHQNQ